jgi:hypothetical protein
MWVGEMRKAQKTLRKRLPCRQSAEHKGGKVDLTGW